MGGGAILQTFGRVIGAGRAGVGGRPSAAHKACSECRSSWNVLRMKGTACACEQKRAEMAMHTSANVAVTEQQYRGVDDWEFAGDGEILEPMYVRDRLIFGSVPTQKEVEDATSDLQEALRQTFVPIYGSPDNTSSSLSSSSVQQRSNLLEVSNILEGENKSCENSVDWTESESHQGNHEVIQPWGHNNVYDAFNLLQKNPAVQGMVISLASDKAVWDAMLKNEKVLEFRHSLQKGESKLEEVTKDSDKPTPRKENAFIQALENAKVKVIEYMEKMADVINQFIGFTDKKAFVEKDGDLLEKALKASMMLSVAVLLVVLVKRV